MANEVAKTFEDGLRNQLQAVVDALPKDLNRERFVQNCMTVFEEKPELKQINRLSLMNGLLKGAYMGLDFMNKECYLIQYGNSVQFQTDYKGEIKFVKRYSIRPIHEIYAKVVREGDYFEEKILDGHPSIDFRPQPLNGGKIMGAFAVALFKDGGMQYETMTVEDIQSVRNNYSRASQSKAWKCSFDEMAKKTVLRRLCKHIETDFESIEARQAWDEGSGMQVAQKTSNPDEVVDAFAQAEVEDIQIREINDDISDAPMPDVFK